MRIKLHLLLVLGLSVLSFQNAQSQSKERQKPLTVVNFGNDIDAPFSSKEMSQIEEVYGNTIQANVLDHPQRIKDIKHILRNRVEIVDAGSKDLSSLPKLSSVELFNDYQPGLVKDFNFNPNSFNPLKYKFNFYSRDAFIYHVDGTSYYIMIKSQFE